MASPFLPLARNQDLSIQRLSQETLVYDERVHRAFCLNHIVSEVWKRCDGTQTSEQIAQGVMLALGTPVSADVVEYALGDLRRHRLLVEQPAAKFPVAGLSRRQMVQRLGAAAALLMPVVTSIVAPPSAHAYGCVLADTPVAMADGSERSAGRIVAGDWIRGFDAVTGRVQAGPVKSVSAFAAERVHTLFAATGEMLQASPTHLLLNGMKDKSGKQVKDFNVGDEVLVYSERNRRVEATHLAAVQIVEQPQAVFGFEMDTYEHTYLSAGLVSHNMVYKTLSPQVRRQMQEELDRQSGTIYTRTSAQQAKDPYSGQ